MKRSLALTLLLQTVLYCWAQESKFNTRLIPTPQQVVRTEGFCATSTSTVETLLVDSIAGAENQEQAYRMEITPNKIHIYYTSDKKDGGLYTAQDNLARLARLWNDSLPCMVITDWPAYKYRGFLDDISRGPIPNEKFRNRQFHELLVTMNMNFANYYTEHTLYNPAYPDISAHSGLTADWLRSQAWIRMANLQCFAHFEKTLRIPFYKDIMDTPFNVDPSKEETYAFLKDQISNLLHSYHPWMDFININCDETEGLGSGRARAYVDSVGADEAYCRHINRVYDLIQECVAEHRATESCSVPKVLMWGDIVGKNPTMLKRLPKEMQYIVWSYGAQESYTGMIAPFKKIHEEQGNDFWVAPGVSHWSSIPQVHNYIQNIAYLARDGYLAGAVGMMNTAWDDSGESLFGDCWHAMAWGAEMAWNPIKSTDPAEAKRELKFRERQFNENYNRWMAIESRRKETAFTTEMIYHVGDLAGNRWVGDWYNTGALMQPLLEFYPSNVGDEMLTRCDSVDYILDQVMHHLDSATVPHFYYACHRIQRTSEKSRLRVMLFRGDPGASHFAQQYFRNLHQLKLEYLRLWDEECTDYSRDIICGRYDHLGNEILELDRKVLVETHGDTVVLRTPLGNHPIYYTLDGRQPTPGSIRYDGPFRIEHSCLVKAVCYNEWEEPVYTERYLLRHLGMGHLTRIGTPYSDYNATYSGGGEKALADGLLGNDGNYADGHWQGYWGEDMDLQYDFGKKTAVNGITMRFLQNTFNWVLAPQDIEIYTSADGKQWKLARKEQFHPDFREGGAILHTDTVRDLHIKTQYLRILVKNPGKLPVWHPSKGQKSYIFCDEAIIE